MPDFKPYRGKGGLNLQIDFTGLAAAAAGLDALPVTMGQGFKTALKGWADDVLARSQALVPVNTGRLKSTGQVMGPEMKDGSWEVHIGYGDRKTAWYAQVVHERLDVRHPVGKAKFLEIPLNENLKVLDQALAAVIEAALGKAGDKAA